MHAQPSIDPMVPALNRQEASLLRNTLRLAIPLRIMQFEKQGGPTGTDFDRARDFGPVLAEKGDVLQFGGKHKGEAAQLFNELARTIAVLAFQPGGVKFGGDHWQGKAKPKRKIPPPPPKRRVMHQ